MTKDVDSEESMTQVTGKKLEYILIAGLSFAVILLIVKPSLNPNYNEESEQQLSVESKESDKTVKAIPSIAVLPFADFSPEKDQEYFSDGISEEILNLLAKTNRLRVAARTSSFAFKGDNTDIREIGKKLEVDTVLEGSIRKSNNKIRVTAQLINVADGYHIWSETFDRELEDVFAIQDEISSSILNSLKIHLLGEEVQEHKQIDLSAYDKFLIANERLQRNSKEDLESAIGLFEEAITIQPDYTEAKVKLVSASMRRERKSSSREDLLEQEKLTDQLVTKYLNPIQDELDYNYELNGVLGRYHQKRFRKDISQEYVEKAIQLNSNYADAYLWRADNHYENADYKAMLADREKAYELNPMSLEISRELAYDYRSFWRPDDADKVIDRMFILHPDHPDAYDAKLTNLTSMGHYAEAVLTVEKALEAHPENEQFQNWLAWGYIYLNKLDKLEAVKKHWTDYEVALRQGDTAKGLEIIEDKLASDDREKWLRDANIMYLYLNDTQKLKTTLVESIDAMDRRNVPWQKRCYIYLIAALKMVNMNDNVQSMMDECRETTEKRLAAGFLCPCSWYRLVEFAIIDNRQEDAVKRAEEWLDNGDSYPNLEIDPLFIRLQDHKKYDTLLERNEAQIQRQIRIYDNRSNQVEREESAAE